MIASVNSYASHPAKRAVKGHTRIVLFFTDVFGPSFLNNRLIMDYFASNGLHSSYRVIRCQDSIFACCIGFLVCFLDYFEGDPIQVSYLVILIFVHIFIRGFVFGAQLHWKEDHVPVEGFDQAAWRDKCVAFAYENVPKWIEGVKAKYGQLTFYRSNSS